MRTPDDPLAQELQPESASASSTAPGADPGQPARTFRRHVVYVPGYGALVPELRRRLFGAEFRKFVKLWGVSGGVAPGYFEDRDVHSATWTAEVEVDGARIEIAHESLCWDDLVSTDLATSGPLKLARSFVTLWDAVCSGMLWRVAQVAPWCAAIWCYPMVTTLSVAAVSGIAGFLLAAGLGGGLLVNCVAIVFWLLSWTLGMRLLERAGAGVDHFTQYGAWQIRYVARSDAVMEARLDVFAARIIAAVDAGAADEILVVGHSTGSFLAIDAVARAYEARPDIGARGPTLSLLTVGAMELHAALHPQAGWLRDRIARLAMEQTLFWAEVVGPWDILNFSRRDPIDELGLPFPANRPNPTFRRAYLTRMLTAKTIARVRRKMDMFRLHQQFVMANEVRGSYDFFSLICGPLTAVQQFQRTRKGAVMSPAGGRAERPARRGIAA